MAVSRPADQEETMSKQKHMNLDNRVTIEKALDNRQSFKAIGGLVGKDCTTISKEVRKHTTHVKTGGWGRPFNDCLNAYLHKCNKNHACSSCISRSSKKCWFCGKCISVCPEYQKYSCPKLLRPPYVCNGCTKRQNCSLEKTLYRATAAQKIYEATLKESRSGFALSEAELQSLDNKVSPLLRQGQSIHHIAVNHLDEVMKSERTLYAYVNAGLFSARNIDMPRTVRMRSRKGKPKAMKVDKACRIGRTYEDYLSYMAEHLDTPVRQLDSVEGVKGGAVLLTVHFVEQSLQLAFLRQSNDSRSVTDIFERLYLELRCDVFIDLFPLLLADNGSEFSNPKALEFDGQGNRRTRVFYCNPNAPYQKGNCENNHEMIRRIIPKGVDIGRYTQAQIDLMMSHINSYARKNLGDKSPYDLFEFQYGKKILDLFHLTRIPADEINLTPDLLKSSLPGSN